MAEFHNPFAQDDGFVNPLAEGYEAPTVAGSFKKGITQGIHSAKGAAYGLAMLAGDALGVEGAKNWGAKGYLAEEEKSAQSAPAVSRFEDVNSISDAAHYVAGGLGQLIPFAATSALGGGVGGVAGRLAVRKGAEAVAKKAVERGVMGGLAASSVGTEAGLIEGDTYAKTGKTDPGAAAGYGLMAGLVDVIPEAALIRNVAKGAKAGGKGLLRTVGEQTALGAGTEGVQTYLENKGVEAVDPQQKALSEEGVSDIANSALIGGIGQGLLAGGGHVIGKAMRRAPQTTPAAETPAITDGVTPGTEAAVDTPIPTPAEIAAGRALAPEDAVLGAPPQDELPTVPDEVSGAPAAPPEPGDWRARRAAAMGGAVNPDVKAPSEEAIARMHDQAAAATKAALRPWHKPDAGLLTKVAGAAVESGMSLDPYATAPTEEHPERVAVTNPPNLQMQNRDRSRPASIAQMNAIAANPDYDRLGTGKSPNEAAPMVSVAANTPVIPPEAFGKSSRVVMGDGSKIAVRYAVIDAGAALASHNADGSVNGDYYAEIPPGTIRALNNGRVAGLQEAYNRGSAEQYRAALIEHADEHGVAPEAIAAVKNPMLVRVYDDAENARTNMGELSNPQSNLAMSAPEQAHNDAERLDVGALEPDESGGVMTAKNDKALRAFLDSIPAAEHGALVTKTGWTKQFGDRVRAAVFAKAYGNTDLVSAATEEADPDVRNVLHALTGAAPAFARVEHGGSLDIRPNLVEAFNLIREAKRKGIKPAEMVAQQELGGRDPMTQMLAQFMVENHRSPRRMAAAFAEAARFLENEKLAATTGDLLGGRPAATPHDLATRINTHLEKYDGGQKDLLAAEPSAQRPAQRASGAHDAPAGDGGKSREKQGARAHAAEPEEVARIRNVPSFKVLPEPSQAGLLAVYRGAADSKPEFDLRIKAIADEVGGEAKLAPLKGAPRAIEKINSDYAGEVGRIKDVLRATIVVPSLDDAAKAVAAIQKAFDVVSARDLFKGNPVDGYRDAKFNVKMGDIIAEVQVNLPAMMQAKGKVHIHYERRSKLERKIQAENRAATPAETRAIQALNAMMKRAYDLALATSARKTDSETGAPLRRADSGSNLRGGSTSQAAPYGTPAPKDTGIPSTSKNSAVLGKDLGKGDSTGVSVPEPQKISTKVDIADSFTLVGSDRKRDSAVQADLFDALEAVQAAVRKLPLREDATPKVITAAEKAMRELTVGGRLSILASRINLDLVRDGVTSLVGKRVTSSHDLAVLAQVYRDPRFETMRYFFVNDKGVVVHETAVSSRMPSATAAFTTTGEKDPAKWLERIAKSVGASGFYALHNHPSGNPMPSGADMRLTTHVLAKSPLFREHVIIDTDAYGLIDKAGAISTSPLKLGAPASRVNDPRFGMLGGAISSVDDLARHVKGLQGKPGIAIIALDSNHTVNSLAQVAAEHFGNSPRFRALMSRFLRASGSGGGAFLVNIPAGLNTELAAKRLADDGVIAGFTVAGRPEDIYITQSRRQANLGGRARLPSRGSHVGRGGVAFAAAEEQLDLFGGKEAVQTARKEMRAEIQSAMPQLDLFGDPVSIKVDTVTKPADNAGKGASNANTGTVRKPRAAKPQGQPAGDLFAVGSERATGTADQSTGGRGDGGDPQAEGRPGAPGDQSGASADGSGKRADSGAAVDQGRRDGASGAGGVRPRAYVAPQRSGLNFRITKPETIGTGGAKEKYRANVDAIKLLKQIEAEKRQATAAEQEVLSRYVGWGGLKNAFFLGHVDGLRDQDVRPNHYAEHGQAAEWARERRELLKLLTSEEYELARGSTPNAHYTAPQVITAMWDAVRHLGFRNGRVLEPAMGVGHFFGLMPEAMRSASTLAGVELDSISGRISQQLYQTADVRVSGFENAHFPKGFFDLAISNVPFGDYKVNDREFNKHKLLIHDYFFAKGLDRVRPGGLVAFITSDGTLDKLNPAVRKLLAESADLVGAVRLPNDAFKANAGTEVTTDILFLRKREKGEKSNGVEWANVADLTTADGPVKINEYYAARPDMMMGTMGLQGTMYGRRDKALTSDGRDLAKALAQATSTLPAGVYKPAAPSKAFTAAPIAAPTELKPGSLFVNKGKVFQKTAGMAMHQPHLDTAKVEAMVALRSAIRAHLQGQLQGADTFAATATALNDAYDRFVKKYGFLNARGNAAMLLEDTDGPLLLALEKWNPDAGTATKADTFTKATLQRQAPVTQVGDAVAAMTVSLNERGRVDLAHMASISGLSEAELIGGLEGRIYNDPVSREWKSAEEYLSGNVRAALRDAEAAARSDPRYEANVEALKAVQPVDVPAHAIRVRLGQQWLSPDVVRSFAHELFGVEDTQYRHIDVSFSPATTDWKVTAKGVDTSKPEIRNVWGVPGADGVKLLEHALNQQKPTIYKTEGNERVKDPVATAAAAEKVDMLRAEFEKWWMAEPQRKADLAKQYNEEFNTMRLRVYNGSHLTLPGTNPLVKLRDNVKDGAWRIVTGGNTLLAHAVGAGKTFTAIAGSMELKRLGLRQKPMHVVPNHMLEQYSREWLQLYPNANLLLARKEDLATADGRRTLSAKIATGNWDGVVITHASFGKLAMSDDYVQQYIAGQVRDIEDAILEAKADQADNRLLKRLEKRKKDVQAKAERMVAMGAKDDVVRFEELGVDQIFVDEAHYFKNLGFQTKMERIAGISDSDSQRATDMFLKTQYLNDLNNQKGGVVFLTGTPISNSVTEMFTMQRYLGMAALKAQKLDNFDAWAAQFGEAVTTYEMRADGGGYAPKTRFAKFVNMGELAQQFGAFADVKTADMLKLPVPKIKGGKPQPITSPMTDAMQDFVADLVARAEAVKSGAVLPTEDNMLKITSDGRKAALDMRLVDPDAPDYPDSKVNRAVAHIFDTWKASTPKLGTQLIFLDQSTPKSGGKFSVYTDIKQKLVKRGIPANEIQFIQDHDTDSKKAALFANVREGRVRILLGSTDKMGTGTNVQQRIVGLGHLDVPWRPSDIEQRDGRAIRQGNMNDEVNVWHGITEGSFDAFMWQTVERKASFIAQAMRADPTTREIEEVGQHVLTYAELKAFASGNPLILEKANVDGELSRLTRSQAAHQEQQYNLRTQATQLKRRAASMADYAARAEADQAGMVDTRGEAFAIELRDQKYGERKDGAMALDRALREVPLSDGSQATPTLLGRFGGFVFGAVRRPTFQEGITTGTFTVFGKNTYTVATGESVEGNLQRLENLVRSIAGEGARARAEAAELTKNAETAATAAEAPFPHEAKVQQLLARQREIDLELGIGKDEATTDGEAVAEPQDPLFAAEELRPWNLSHDTREKITHAIMDTFQTQRSLNPWHKTVGTMFHLAQTNPAFKRVYDAGQRFINDTARIANEVADLAPDMLPKLSGVREIFKLGPSRKDLKAVSAAIFRGTLDDKKQYTPADLAAMGLTEKQAALYDQTRASINRSLELLSITEMARQVRGIVAPSVIEAVMRENTHHGAAKRLQDALDEKIKTSPIPAEVEHLNAVAGGLMVQYGRIRELIREGYAPLMRFGKYAVGARDAQGNQQYFGLFESQREANAMARLLRADSGLNVYQTVQSQAEHKMFAGMTPDTLELFATALGLDKTQAFQDYIRLTLNNRSTLKRLLPRKGIAGFEEDVQRVLAAFVTSNSRASSSNLHSKEMNDSVEAIKGAGDVKDHAVELVTYLRDQQDEAPSLRGFLFVNYLGGSLAAAMVNMTQPIMMTLPYLNQFGAARAAAALGKGLRDAVVAPRDPAIRAALARAETEGTVAPHEIHQLYAESIRGLGQNIYLRKGLKVWGSMFALAEQFNRRSTFIAAFDVASQMTPDELAATGRATPYDFAVHAVAETQGVYNRGNRPVWGRGAIGATLMTFKQFSISYMEFLKRLPPRERALALGLLVLAAGVQGLPFADDLDDIIDTIAQSLGYNWNTKAAKRAFLANTLGKELGGFVLHGTSTLPGMPLDIQGRLSVGNLVPGTGLLKKSTTDKTREITDVLGPVGGLVTNVGRAFSDVQSGNLLKAGREFAPKAVKDIAQAVDMMQSGYYMDGRGRRVLATDVVDAAAKGVGFQPAKVAAESRKITEGQQTIDLVRVTQTAIADKWAEGLFEKDSAKVKEAQAELRDWNAKNPDALIRIQPQALAQRVKQMLSTREQRFSKAAPVGVRQAVSLQQ